MQSINNILLSLLVLVPVPLTCGQSKEDREENFRNQVLKCLENVYWTEVEHTKLLETEMASSSETASTDESDVMTSYFTNLTMTAPPETMTSLSLESDHQWQSVTRNMVLETQTTHEGWNLRGSSMETIPGTLSTVLLKEHSAIFEKTSYIVSHSSPSMVPKSVQAATGTTATHSSSSSSSLHTVTDTSIVGFGGGDNKASLHGILPSQMETAGKESQVGTDRLPDAAIRTAQFASAHKQNNGNGISENGRYPGFNDDTTFGVEQKTISRDLASAFSIHSANVVLNGPHATLGYSSEERLPKRRRNNKKRKRKKGKGRSNRKGSRRRHSGSGQVRTGFHGTPLHTLAFSKTVIETLIPRHNEERHIGPNASTEWSILQTNSKTETTESASADYAQIPTTSSPFRTYDSTSTEIFEKAVTKLIRQAYNTSGTNDNITETTMVNNSNNTSVPLCPSSATEFLKVFGNDTSNITNVSSLPYASCDNSTANAFSLNATQHNASGVSTTAIKSSDFTIIIQRVLRNLTSKAARKGFLKCVRKICGQGHGESGCGSYMYFTSPCGSFSSIGYTAAYDSYHNHASCQWIIQVPTNHIVNLTFVTFSIDYSGSACSLGSVDLYDGTNVSAATFIKRYCGNREPWSVYSTGRGLAVLLTSTVRHRFRAEYEAVNESEWRFLKPAMKLLEEEGRLVTSNATVSVTTKTHSIHKWYIKAAIRKFIQLSWQIRKNENDTSSFFKVYRGRSKQSIPFPGTDISGESARSGNLTSLLFELNVVVGVSIEYDDVFSFVAKYRTLDPPKCSKRSRYRSSRPVLCVEDMKLTATDNIKIHKSAFQINQNGTYEQYSIEIGRPGMVVNFKLHQLWFPYKNNRLCNKAGIMLYTVTSHQHRPLLGPICSRNAIFQEPIALPDTIVHVVVYAEPYNDKVELSSAYFLDIELELVQDFPRVLLSPPSDYLNSTWFSGQQDGLTITVNNFTTADSVSHSLSLSLTESTLSNLSHILIFYAGQYNDVRSATFSIQINVTDSHRRAHATVKMHSDSDLQDCIKAVTNIGNGKVPLLTTAHFEGTSFDVEYSIRCPWVASSFRLHLAVYTASNCIADYTTPLSWNNDEVHAVAIPFDCSHRHCNCFHQSSPVPHPSLQQKDLYYYHTKFGTGIDGPPWQYYIIELRPEECQSLSSAHTFIESKHAEIREFMNTTTGDSVQLAYWKRPTSSASVIKTIGSYEVNVRLYFESDYMMSPKRHLELVYSLFHYKLTIDGDTYEASECRGGEIAFDGACYGLNASPANITWAESEAACRRLGGNLVSIVSEKELSFLKTATRTRWKNAIYLQKKNVVFIGLMKEKNENWFRWSDSSPIGVTDWFRPSWPTDFNVTDILEHPSISKLLRLYRFLETQQPLMDVSLNCTIMLIHGAELFTNWVTIPCYFPMERASYICKRMTKSRIAKLSKETRSYFKKIGIDHDVYNNKKHDIGKSVPSCERDWLYHQGVCYRLSNLDSVYNTSTVEPRHLQSRAEHETWESSARMCNMSVDVCRPAFPMENMATTPDLVSALERYQHGFGDGGVWIPDNAGTCSTLLNAGMSLAYTVGNIESWFQHYNVSFQKEQWFLFELLKKSPLKLRTQYIVQDTRHVLCRTPPKYKFMTKPTADPTLDHNAVEKYCPSPWHFRCSDKTCILQHHKCDGIKDCLDESDELDCLYLDSCDKHRCYHKCNNGQYVPLSKACDFIADCKDASDESNCVFQNCPNDTFACKNGQCVPLEHRCDGKVHCFDGSDEKQCDFSTTACLRGTRVPAISPSIVAPFCPSQLNITMLYQTRHTCAEGTFSCSDSDPSCYSLAESCIYELDDKGHLFPCRMGEHLSNCEDFKCPSDYYFKCPRSYCISLSRVCDGTWDCPYGLDEKSCERYSCPGMFRCQGHTECIHHDLVCDGIVHCKNTGDDEKFCKTPKCPLGCYCMGLTIACSKNDLRELPAVDKEIRGLFLPFNKLAPNSSSFHGYHYLRVLDISENDIKELIPNTFQDLVNLVELNLANNDIAAIKKGAFVGLANLRTLNIGGNPLYVLKSFAFSELKNLPSLNIYKTKLHTIESNAFHGMSELKNLSIEQSDLTTVTNHSFSGLQKLELLSLDGNKLPPQSVPYGIFLNLSDNITLNTGSFRLCCLAQHIPKCLPHSNEFSSCEYLIDDIVIRLLAGCLAGVAFTCNLVVIIWRCTKVSNSEKIIPLLLENMAYSNMLMGLYLVIVTSADLHYRFIGPVYAVEFDEPWRDMFWCRFAGFVFVLSNQVSMLTVGIVMYECYACVVLPHLSNFRLKRRTAFISIAWLWSVSMLFSLLPFLGIPRLNVRSPVCQIFHFSQGTDQDWGYFTFIFLGFYSLVLVAISYGLLRIWCHIPKKDQNLDEDYFAERTAIKRRVVRVVTMDVACWWMVHILGILALAGVQIDKQLSAYTMLVIWPMPAVVNPILYFIFYIKKGIKYPDYMEVYEPCEKHVSFFGMEVETSI